MYRYGELTLKVLLAWYSNMAAQTLLFPHSPRRPRQPRFLETWVIFFLGI
jgi:hypothetical protein